MEKSVVNYKDILYNMDRVQGEKVVVVEGITDVWRMGDGFVASFGTTLTSAQINLSDKTQFEEPYSISSNATNIVSRYSLCLDI